MARITQYLLDGEFSEAADGKRARYVHQVSELGGSAPSRLPAAVFAPGIPRRGDAHPSESGLTVERVTARATSDPEIALVTVDYASRGADSDTPGNEGLTITVRGDLITEETIKNVDGDLMQTTYVGIGSIAFQTHRVEVQRPSFSLVFSRIEDDSALALAYRYAGKVNSGSFQGAGEDRWLCTLESDSQEDGRHRVRYTFTYNNQGWQARLTAAVNGLIPLDASLQNGGIRIEQVYERENFNVFGLPAA